jgi:hypothetical protein
MSAEQQLRVDPLGIEKPRMVEQHAQCPAQRVERCVSRILVALCGVAGFALAGAWDRICVRGNADSF